MEEKGGFCDSETLEAVRNGDMEAALRLYTANKRLIAKIAARYSRIDCAVGFDDLMQSAFFAIPTACRTFDPERGGWPQALTWALQNVFRREVRGARGTTSLDVPVYEDGNETIIDRVPGTESADGQTMRLDFRQSVRRMIDRNLDTSTAEIIKSCDLGGENLQEYCRRCGRSYVSTTAKRRIALLRLSRCAEARELYRDALDLDSRCFRCRPAETVALYTMAANSRKGRNETESEEN